MHRVVIFLVWCLLGFCLAMAGCRASLSAEKLQASVGIERPLVSTVAADEPKDD